MITLGYISLILVMFAVLVYWGFAFVILYHLIRFGIGTQPKKIAVLFLFGAVALFFSSITLYISIDKSAVKDAIYSYANHK